MYKTFYSIILLSVFACTNVPENIIQREVEALKSLEDHKSFLEEIFAKDQGKIEYTRTENEFALKNDINSINLIKIDCYLQQFEYPDRNELGEIAALTPWVVIHHYAFADAVEIRLKYFDILEKAYQNGNIDDEQFSFYLNRTYQLKTGNSFHIEGTFTAEEKINKLYELLNIS